MPLKLDSVTESNHLMLDAEGVKPGYLPEERQNQSDGGKFITVNTIVTNTSRGSINFTCGFGVQAHLFNKDGQRYDPIQDLYRVPGNPQCNDSLNPGFSIEISWSFEIPESMKATEFGFANPETNYDDLTLVDVTEASREDTPGSEDSPPAQSPIEEPQSAVEEPSRNEVRLQNEGFNSSPDNPALAEFYAEQ